MNEFIFSVEKYATGAICLNANHFLGCPRDVGRVAGIPCA